MQLRTILFPPVCQQFQGLAAHHVLISFGERMCRQGTRCAMVMQCRVRTCSFFHFVFSNCLIFKYIYIYILYIYYIYIYMIYKYENTFFELTMQKNLMHQTVLHRPTRHACLSFVAIWGLCISDIFAYMT